MRILIVGNGGREHALLWKLGRDAPARARFFVTRPNGGMLDAASVVPFAADDTANLVAWVRDNLPDLVVVGPEGPLAAGLADRLRALGVPVFGPSAAAARIESSKAFAKEVMISAGVPTADYACFTDLEAARRHILERGAPIVVKASGLAGGKGAVVCQTVSEALDAACSLLAGSLGEAGNELVIEEFMEGEELSIFALTDGENTLILPPSQDHKRVGEGDSGPNTGGMGAYTPVAIATDTLVEKARELVFRPVLAELAGRGSPFAGLLYAGLMVNGEEARVVEFNCRFGDPETQVVLPLMAGSLLEPALAVAEGSSIENGTAPAKEGACVTTVVAAQGYPGRVETGAEITIEPDGDPADSAIFFHAGTAIVNGSLCTSSGRVVGATATAATLADAVEASRLAAGRVRFSGAFFRSDIGWRELAR